MPLESDIDALYQLPMAKFTGARNALAKRIGGEDGKRVKSLVKPAAVPSVVNRLYWQSKPIYERLLKAGSDLRRAQLAALGGSGTAALATATAVHREALAEAVQRAAQLAGLAGGRSATDDLARMLEVVSLAPTHPETRGRLTALVRPAGFEALAGALPALRLVRPAAASPRLAVSRAPAARRRRVPSSAELTRREQERQRLEERVRRKRDAAIATAARLLARAVAAESRAKAAADRAYAALESARHDRRAAEQALRRLKS